MLDLLLSVGVGFLVWLALDLIERFTCYAKPGSHGLASHMRRA
jgi:hypothetical protein